MASRDRLCFEQNEDAPATHVAGVTLSDRGPSHSRGSPPKAAAKPSQNTPGEGQDRSRAGRLPYKMLSYIQSLSVVTLCVILALGLVRILSRRLEQSTRKRANGVNGWQLSILGSVYAVVLGFMLSDAWLAYQTATDDVRNEAAAALTIYRTATLLPRSCSVPLQQAAGGYIKAVLDSEWHAMQQHQAGLQAEPFLRSMWGTVSNCESASEEPRQEGIARALETLQMRRDARTEDATGHLPLIMWSVLLFGAVVVVASSCLLSNEKQSVHCFHVVSLTMLISVTLLAISDLDRPFDGATRITSSAFQKAQREILQPAAH